MDDSNVSILTSNLACTSNALPSIHNHQSCMGNRRKSPQAVVLNGINLPVVQIAQQEGQQAPFQLASGGSSFAIENGNLSVIFTPQSQTILQKSPAQALTLNIVNTLPITNLPASHSGTSSGKSKSIGKHICAHCGRDCLKPSVLEKHIRSHTGERPFPCNICGISFKTQSNLYKHRRTQTHVNNAKQSFDSDCSSCHEDKLHVQVGQNTAVDSSIDKNVLIQNKNLIQFQESDDLPGNKEEVSVFSSVKIHEKAHGDSDYPSQTIVSPGRPNLQKAVIDPKSTSSNRHGQLQRQHEACVDKQWDSSPSERKLKKCESTDSGYLSHSDSADLQMFAGSPLHSLSECSIESENILSISSGDSEDKTSSSHKKNLEEHISMLISQNKAVVDNTHLDNVRPRKTALSKQGSIDLPMPYTFKDSFHFDIKSLDANRNKVSICSAKSTFTPSEKNKPLFFHSVPTQISTTIESIILTRSNSLPFVESGRLKDRMTVHNIKSHGVGKQPLNASYGNLLLSNTATACTVDFSSSHPRGLVRQAAVDEMQISNGSDSTTEEIKEKKKITGDQLPSKSKTSNKKAGQRKSNMFSHEKWQIYGDETFKKLYQKIKKNEQVKKSKQDTPESKCTVSNETCLQSACDLEKPSETSTSIPMATLPASNLQFTCGFVMTPEIDVPLPIENHPIALLSNTESGAQENWPESQNFQSDLKVCNVAMNGSQNVQGNVPTPSTRASENSSIVVNENLQKGLSISHVHDSTEICHSENFQSHEKSPSDRKKLKVAKLKGELLYSVSLEVPDDSVEHQNKNVDYITDSRKSTRMLDDHGASTILSCHSFSTILNKNVLSSGEVSGQMPEQSKNSQFYTPSTHPSTMNENIFSPRYLIKFHLTGTSVEKSVLPSNHPSVCGSSSRDSGLFNAMEDTNLKSLHVPTKLCHATLIENQPKFPQKHDSVIAPFGKISLNEESVPMSSSTKISEHLTQIKSVDTQVSQYEKVRFDTPEKEYHVSEDHRVVKDLILKEMDLKSSMALVCSNTMSTSKGNKLPQDSLFQERIWPGQTSVKPLSTGGLLNQESSLFSTTSSYSPSGICNVKVTSVSFSTMNTEPKSTWCWLDRCLPLPAEQKEKSYSVYASLTSKPIKERGSEPNERRIEKDMNQRTTTNGQPMMSSLLMSPKQKPYLEEETDSGNSHPLVKRSSKKGTVMKSRHVKRSKDGTRGRSHSKLSQYRTQGTLIQDQQQKKISCPSTLDSGENLLKNINFELSDKEGSSSSGSHPSFRTGDVCQESEDKAILDSKRKEEGTISQTSIVLEQLVTGKNYECSQSSEKMAHPESPLSTSLIWQESCLNVLPTGNEVQGSQHLRVCPPQKHVRKLLHRSKTIGHSLGDNAIGSTSWLSSSDPQPRVSVEPKDGIRRSSLQNIHLPDSYEAANSSCSGSNLEPETSVSWKLHSEDQGESSDLQCPSFKSQKKINLEVMRKQTHVEYSDSSSDDEDRLYIEILE
ncbi:zinc finger protein 831 [Leptodactylus fuscus]|uniref:zinc finger protein 831 n=1 Tax=Leptodactylus fuscus TaxID=238119 RepID=UPI003F4EB3ED